MTMKKYIGACDVKLAKLDASFNPLAFVDLGEVPMIEIDPTVEFAESFSTGVKNPNRRDLHLAIKEDLVVHLTLTERQLLNMEVAAFGETSSEVAGNYTGNAAFPPGIIVGETYEIPGGHVGITTPVVKDSAGSPVTVNASKYSIDANAPLITFLDVTGFTQPFTMFSYAYAKADKLKLMSKQSPDFCLIAVGRNLAIQGSTESWYTKLYRLSFKPAAKITVKAGSDTGTGNAFAVYELEGVPLVTPGLDEFGIQRIF
jgi:hypothetical protein